MLKKEPVVVGEWKNYSNKSILSDKHSLDYWKFRTANVGLHYTIVLSLVEKVVYQIIYVLEYDSIWKFIEK